MPRHLSLFVASLICLFTAAPLCAQTGLLKTVPDDALGLIVVNNMSDASAKVQKLTAKMNLPVPELLPIVKMFTGAQEGVDDNGSIAAVALADDDDDSTWGVSLAAFVPVTDYQAFIKQLKPEDPEAAITEVTVMDQQFLVAKKGNFAVLCDTDHKATLEAILASTKSVAGTLAPLAPWLAEQQIAVVVTPAGKKLLFETIVEKLADDDESAEENEEDAADRKKGDAEEKSDNDCPEQAGKQAMRTIKNLLTSAEPQLTLLGLGIRIDESIALHVTARVLFAPEGALAKWGGSVKPPKAGVLVGLPAGKFVLAYGGVAVKLTPEFMKLIDLITESGLERLGFDDASRKQYYKALQRHRANQLSIGGLLGPLRPGDSITGTSVAVEQVKDAKEHLKLTRELFQLLQKGSGKGDAKLPVYELNEVTIGDLKAIEIITDMSAMVKELEAAGPAPAAALQGLMSGMFGSEGKMRAYFAVADETHLVSAFSKPLLQRGIEHVRSGAAGLEADPEIAKTTSLLPSGAQWAAYASPQGLVQWADTLLRQAMPAEMQFKLPAFPPSDPIGMAAKVSSSELDAELVLPESVVAGIGQYVILVQQMIQGGQAPLP